MKPKFFGQFLLDRGEINYRQLDKAVKLQEERTRKIGEIAYDKNILDKRDIEEVLKQQTSVSMRFGELAVAMGYMSDEQVSQLLDIQREDHIYIGEALVEVNALDHSRLTPLLEEFREKYGPFSKIENLLPDDFEQDKNEKTQTILKLTQNAFKRVGDMELKFGKAQTGIERVRNKFIFAMSYFQKCENLKYFLTFSEEAAEQISGNIKRNKYFSFRRSELGPRIQQFLAIITDYIRSQLCDLGKQIDLSSPCVRLKDGEELICFSKEPTVFISPCITPYGDSQIGIAFYE